MTSITRWLRGIWSGSRNEPDRDPGYTTHSSPTYSPSVLPRPVETKSATVTASELSVHGVSGAGTKTKALRGILTFTVDEEADSTTARSHQNASDQPTLIYSHANPSNPPISHGNNTRGRKVVYTGTVNLVSVSDVGHTGVQQQLHPVNTTGANNNTWTPDRGIHFGAVPEPAPELEAVPLGSNLGTTSSPRRREDSHGTTSTSSNSVPSSTASTASETETSLSHPDPGERRDSDRRARASSPSTPSRPAEGGIRDTTSYTEREATPRRIRVRLPSSTATLSPEPAPSEPESHSRPNPAPTFGGFNVDQWRGELTAGAFNFNPTFSQSPPTPPASSFVKKERSESPSVFPPTPPAKIPISTTSTTAYPVNTPEQPEMKQIVSQTTSQTMTPTAPFTPSRPTRGSTGDSQTSRGGAALTPPPTKSAQRQKALIAPGTDSSPILETQYAPSNPQTTPNSPPSTPTPNRQADYDAWSLTPTPSPTTTPPTQTTARPVNAPAHINNDIPNLVRIDNTTPFTTLREIYSTPLSTTGHRILPRNGPKCLSNGCNRTMELQDQPSRSATNNGRYYYKCSLHGWDYGTFADLKGEDPSRSCWCPGDPPARRTEFRRDGKTKYFWKCLEMRCRYKVFSS